MVRKDRVLFVCIGNACRSQMAEGFARRYGGDVLEAASAGLAHATHIPVDTLQVMEEKNIPLDGQFPKGLDDVEFSGFDLVVNMSGVPLPPNLTMAVREWEVPDPVTKRIDFHRKVRDAIETLVMKLILDLRRTKG
jgi:arsenate reductase (thioredoxin)